MSCGVNILFKLKKGIASFKTASLSRALGDELGLEN
jgi:hypothetical protein